MKKLMFVAILLMFGLVAQTQAVSTNSNQGAKAGQTDATAVQGNQAGNTAQTQDGVKDKSKKENKGKFNAELHRSAVADFAQSLLAVADREGGIGQEIRVIAQEQNDIKDRASDLINAVENRSKVKTFFIGTSYKNLGELRSQMVQTRNRIEQLKRLAEKAENEGDKTELQNQIQALEKEQTNISNFITQNESKFSLFGWAVKLFRK